MSPITLALLCLLAIHTSQAVLFATKVVQRPGNEAEAVQLPNHIRLRRSGAAGLTHPECHRSAISDRCALTGDYDACVRASCSECIAESTFNPFDMYCMRLTACVCTIIKDATCYAVTAADCY